jgi:hypothetical protein
MKEYKLILSDSLKKKEKEILEYILVEHWKDGIFQSGFCSCLLGINKFNFQTEILDSFGVSFMGDDV